jgi:hypothetical protein
MNLKKKTLIEKNQRKKKQSIIPINSALWGEV